MFASETKHEIKFGDDFVTVRKLSAYQLDLARDEAQARNVNHLRRLGGELLTAINSQNVAAAAERIKEKRAEPNPNARYDGLDRMTVLSHGIVAWSRGDVTPEKLRDLDEEVADKVFKKIVDITVPPRAEAEAATEKG